jgi:heme exporter protein C
MIRRVLPTIFFFAAAPVVLYSVVRVFLHTGIEKKMGTVQKIFYFHVPLAWIMMALAVTCGIAAAIQLRRSSVGRSRTAEALSIAAGELVLITGLGVLITGPIWGHATWGRAWTWDARQVSTGLLWMVFAAFVLLRRYGAAGSERLAAALAVFGAIDVPIIYYAVKIWKTTHPTTEVVGSLPAQFWNALWPALIALMLITLGLLFVRTRQELTAGQLDDAWIALDERTRGKPASAAAEGGA